MDFLEKVQGFLTEPSKAFDVAKGENLNETIKYYVIIAAVYSVLLTVSWAFMGSLIGSMMGTYGRMLMGGGAGLVGAISTFVSLIIGAFIGGAILHIFVYIVGGRKGIERTIKAVMYASTPGLLLGWIPFIGFFAWIWSLIVEILGIRQLHELTTGRAVLAVLIPIIIGVVLIIIAVFAAFLFAFGPPGRGF